MKNSLQNILAISVLLFVACTSDEEERAFQTTVLTIPFAVFDTSVNPLSDTEARSTGDPGVMEKLPAPKYLYVWVTEGDRVLAKEVINTSSWTKKAADAVPERWEYEHTVDLGKDVVLAEGATVQVYAIAAQHSLNLPECTTRIALDGITLDLSSWQKSDEASHSWALGNLYSTPLALMADGNSDATAAGITESDDRLHNGTYTVSKVGTTISINEPRPIYLYHCAAKADFKWEVIEAKRPGVKIQRITINGLPTQLKVFDPTHNPAGAATCSLLAPSGAVNPLTDDNCWLGREYAYILQPPTTTSTSDGQLNYSVTFTGRTPDEKNHPAAQTTSPATNPVFTTWYRVNADITEVSHL